MKYNYIFSGLGLAAMMTIIKMIDAGLLNEMKILIIEPENKNDNDKTWCFWEKKQGNWNDLVTHSWEQAFFIDHNNKINCLENNLYKMIESKNFYAFFKQKSLVVDIEWKYEKIESFCEVEDFVKVITAKNEYLGEFLFNSVFELNKIKSIKKYPLLQQHFVGWFIETSLPVFNPNQAVFMDFTVEQNNNTRFMYVLPTFPTKALIEFTFFSSEVFEQEVYEEEIKKYIKKLGINVYQTKAIEKGNIPMTSYPFWKKNSSRILNIGTAGGWTKASTGFTFKNVDKYTDELIIVLEKGKFDFSEFKKANRYNFYDELFLDVLHNENHLGSKIFSSMFSIKNPEIILKFLDEKTTFFEDFKIILSCPKIPFIKSFFRKIFKRM